jgi:hypothetical protein
MQMTQGDQDMPLQQVIDVVRLHHVFWQIESRRAPHKELKDCAFFLQQCQAEIAFLEGELETAATHSARDGLAHQASQRSLSNARPATTMIGGRSKRSIAERDASRNAAAIFYEWHCIEVSPSLREHKRKLRRRMTPEEAATWAAANPGKRLEVVPNSGKDHRDTGG